MEHTYTKLFIIHLKLKFHLASCTSFYSKCSKNPKEDSFLFYHSPKQRVDYENTRDLSIASQCI